MRHSDIADAIIDWGLDNVMPWALIALVLSALVLTVGMVWSFVTQDDPAARVYFGSRGCYVVNTKYNPALKISQTHSEYLSEPVCAAISEARQQ